MTKIKYVETGAMASPIRVGGRPEVALTVRMKKFNMSGHRAGAILTLPSRQADEWIHRGWAEMYVDSVEARTG
jgi:hypothetical protein